MAEAITMPKLGFDMREGVLIRWVKNEGETVNKGDILVEIETDKATVEVESSASGVVRKLLASQGDVVPVGAVMAIIGTADENIDDLVAAAGASTSAAPAPAEAAPAAAQTAPEPAPVAAAPAPATTQPSPEPAPVATTPAAPQAAPVAAAAPAAPTTGPVKASPLAKKVASDAKLDLALVRGTGPGGRIIRKDVEAALKAPPVSAAAPVPATATKAPAVIPLPSMIPVPHADETIQTTKLRQAIGRRLVESKQNLPHFYVTCEYKMDALLETRKRANALLPEGEKISVNDFIIKAVALALRQFPNLNASLAGDKIIRHGAINVGVAVTVEGGLLTVVSKDTDQKPLRLISTEVRAMAARAREGKVKPDDVDGSTFSTSNLGMYDVDNFIAIINPPEAAILAISAAREVPVVEDGQLKVGNRMKATISVDHRVSDGAEAAKFMLALAAYLEEPLRLML
jgi:pyruvate dehydrogenase E2 component (dihydrolipoamide acetyltransferase)